MKHQCLGVSSEDHTRGVRQASASDLLNRTVTYGARLRSYVDRNGRAVVGYKVSEANAVGDCVPPAIYQSPARLYPSVLHTLKLDEAGLDRTCALAWAFSCRAGEI